MRRHAPNPSTRHVEDGSAVAARTDTDTVRSGATSRVRYAGSDRGCKPNRVKILVSILD